MSPGAPVVGVALKWAPLRLLVDPLTGEVAHDPLSHGLSDADRSALEVALRLAERLGGTVRAATVGPGDAAAVLREALEAGAREAVHVLAEERLLPGSPTSCRRTAGGLAIAFRGCAFVVCGDLSTDGGSASVPGLLAAETGVAQALGLVAVADEGPPDGVVGDRRLDRGARERVRVTAPAVLSVEAGAARLRRSPLASLLGAATATIEVIHPPGGQPDAAREATVAPYRPRARVVPPPPQSSPPSDRIRALLGIDEEPREASRVVRLEPAEAASEIAEQLRAWGVA